MSDGAAAAARGPVQLLVVGFDGPDAGGEALVEFERLRTGEAVRLIDLLVLQRDAAGAFRRIDHPAITADGAVLEALVAHDEETPVDDADERWSLDTLIPNGSTAALVLVEHRWAVGARDAIQAAGGAAVADAWVHPEDLAAAGL